MFYSYFLRAHEKLDLKFLFKQCQRRVAKSEGVEGTKITRHVHTSRAENAVGVTASKLVPRKEKMG